jgi:DNA-binding transcriptional ArsR family regulator
VRVPGGYAQQAARLAALGHDVRLRLVCELVAAHPAGLVAGHLRQLGRLPASTLSHHLAVLARQGLIERTREGRFVRYRASPAGLSALLDFLTTSCAVPAMRAAGEPPLYD